MKFAYPQFVNLLSCYASLTTIIAYGKASGTVLPVCSLGLGPKSYANITHGCYQINKMI